MSKSFNFITIFGSPWEMHSDKYTNLPDISLEMCDILRNKMICMDGETNGRMESIKKKKNHNFTICSFDDSQHRQRKLYLLVKRMCTLDNH